MKITRFVLVSLSLLIPSVVMATELMPPVQDVTVVCQVGDAGAPTAVELAVISPPASSDEPTVSTMLTTAQAVLDSLPPSVVNSAIDDLARVGGSRIGCAFDRTWSCWLYVGGRTYYCSAGAVIGCGSFLGTW